MAYPPVHSPPAEYAVAQDDFDTLRFALHTTVEFVEILKNLHGGARGQFLFRPLAPTRHPLLECRHPLGIAAESHPYWFALRRLAAGLNAPDFFEWIVPTCFEPGLKERRRNRWVGELGAGDLEYEIR